MKKITNFKLFVTEMDKTQKAPGRDIEDEDDAGKKQIHLGSKSLIKAKDLKTHDAEANKAFSAAYNKTQKKTKVVKEEDEHQVGDDVLTQVGGRWIPAKITKPKNPQGNYGVKFKAGSKTVNYLSSTSQLKKHKPDA